MSVRLFLVQQLLPILDDSRWAIASPHSYHALAAKLNAEPGCSSQILPERHTMTNIPYRTALIIGAGPGISASLARMLSASGLQVALAARNVEKLAPLAAETGALAIATDAADPASVSRLFEAVDGHFGEADLVIYNASARAHGPLAELDPETVRTAIGITAFGGFLATQQAARRMVPKGHGAIFLTGASASVKGFPLSAASNSHFDFRRSAGVFSHLNCIGGGVRRGRSHGGIGGGFAKASVRRRSSQDGKIR
jgi:hypothetical protein